MHAKTACVYAHVTRLISASSFFAYDGGSLRLSSTLICLNDTEQEQRREGGKEGERQSRREGKNWGTGAAT